MADLVTVERLNQTYIRVNCEPSIAYELRDACTFKVPGYQFMPAYRSGNWSGEINLFNVLSRQIYAGLVDHIANFCIERGYQFVDNARETVEFSYTAAGNFIDSLELKLTPRQHQIDAFVHAVKNKRSMLLSPTASGKSLIIYLLIRYYNLKTLVLVPTTGLVAQMRGDFIDYGMSSDRIHCITAGKDKESDADVIIATWQSVYKLPKSYFSQFSAVIGDECHGFKAKSLTSIMTKLDECSMRFGLTGTLDGTQTHRLILEGLFGPVYRAVTTSSLMEKKLLSELEIKCIVLEYQDAERKSIAKLNYQAETDFLITHEKRNKFIKNLALSLSGNTLILFQFVEKHGKPLYEMIKAEAGDRRVYFVSGEVGGEARNDIRELVEKDDNAIVVASSGVFSVGVNLPSLRNCIFALPGKAKIKTLQSIGRILRLSSTKNKSVLMDISDDLSWKAWTNFSLKHFAERVKIYAAENFSYKIFKVKLGE
jgi:superfamily II DNA or RNA helicase